MRDRRDTLAKRTRGAVCALAFVTALGVSATAAGQPVCAGDCNGDRTVAVDEIVTAVAVALGQAPVAACLAADPNGDGAVTVDEVIRAVTAALEGCRLHTHAIVVATDFFAGSYGVIELDPPRRVSPARPERRIHQDAVVRVFGGLVYIVNRLSRDNIQILDPARGYATVLQCSTGNGSNPRDIVVVAPDKAYVTRFEERTLWIVNPAARRDCRDFLRGTIDLSALADRDGIPDMDQMAVVDGRLYVALQRLDINTALRLPAQNGALAVIDVATDRLVGAVELSGRNPFAATKGLLVHGGAIHVAQAGLFNEPDGGIERVEPRAGRAEGFYVTERDLGGDIVDFVLVHDRLGYAVVNRPGFRTGLVSFDPSTGQRLATVRESDGFTLFDIELNDRGELFLADRARLRPGVRIFRAADGAPLVAAPIDVGLPPFEIAFWP